MLVAWVAFPALLTAISLGWAALLGRLLSVLCPLGADAGDRLRGGRRRRRLSHARRRDRRPHDPGRHRRRGARARRAGGRSPGPAGALGARGWPPPPSASTRRRLCSPARRRSPASSASTTPRPGWRSPTGCARSRPRPRRPGPVELRGDARLQPRRRLSGRRLHPVRGRGAPSRPGPRLADPAYMAWLAAALAAALWSLTRPLACLAAVRSAIAFIAAQSALLYGYYMWGGVKELAAAALIAGVAALIAPLASSRFSSRGLVLTAVMVGGLAGVLSAGGLIWVVPALAVLGASAWRALGAVAWARRAVGLACRAASSASGSGHRRPAATDLLAADRRRRPRQPDPAAGARSSCSASGRRATSASGRVIPPSLLRDGGGRDRRGSRGRRVGVAQPGLAVSPCTSRARSAQRKPIQRSARRLTLD